MPKVTQSPGAVLKAMMEEYQLNPFKLSKDINLSPSGVRQVVIGKTKISVPVALRLAKYFNTTAHYWLDLQKDYELAEAAKDQELSGVISAIEKAKKPAAASKSAGKAQGEKKAAAKQDAPEEKRKKSGDASGAKPAARAARSKREA
ncbi:MAG: HigA family addiction module antidote protein [Treponema sp.]|nr:HigA family addiction module antidote protein [Treponema sp.]